METTVTNFWNCFVKVQLDMLFAYNNNNQELIYHLFNQLVNHPVITQKKLCLVISFPSHECPKASLHFMTRGLKKKKILATELIEQAPKLDTWTYRVGVQPYEEKNIPFSLFFTYINQTVYGYQVYVHIYKIYKTTNKLHLHIYMDLNRPGVPKFEIKHFAKEILLFYLGEDMFYKHISTIKIVRRKLTKVNYFPLRDLKNLIQFKSPH